jgi:ferredoxin-nitrite reductase
MSSDFTPEQKRYLERFGVGLNAAWAARGSLPSGGAVAAPTGPDAIRIKAQDRVVGKLACDEHKGMPLAKARLLPCTGKGNGNREVVA